MDHEWSMVLLLGGPVRHYIVVTSWVGLVDFIPSTWTTTRIEHRSSLHGTKLDYIVFSDWRLVSQFQNRSQKKTQEYSSTFEVWKILLDGWAYKNWGCKRKPQIKVISSKNTNRFYRNEFYQNRFSFDGIGAWRSLQSDSKNDKPTR